MTINKSKTVPAMSIFLGIALSCAGDCAEFAPDGDRDLARQTRRYHSGIVIEDNVFETLDVPLLCAKSVDIWGLQTSTPLTRDFADAPRPIWPGSFPDPTTWLAEDGTWRATSTSLEMLKSDDFLHWETTGRRAFSRDQENALRKKWPYVWAPDVIKLQDEYLMYVSLVVSATNSAIAVFSSESADGPFRNGRLITKSADTGIRDTIDPEVVRDDRNDALWLFFGSTGKMHRVRLAPDGKSLAPGAEYRHVAGLWGNEKDDPTRSRIFEGAYLHRRDGYWYLFASRGFYADHTYAVVVGRSTTLDGPFLDREGRKMTDGFATTVIESKKGDPVFGPGHNAEIKSINGRDYMLLHAHVAGENARARSLFLAEVDWDSEGWPTARLAEPKCRVRLSDGAPF